MCHSPDSATHRILKVQKNIFAFFTSILYTARRLSHAQDQAASSPAMKQSISSPAAPTVTDNTDGFTFVRKHSRISTTSFLLAAKGKDDCFFGRDQMWTDVFAEVP
jgi:hypothetical protein